MADVLKQQYEMVPVASLTTHPENAKRGDVAAIAASIRRHEFYGALVVQRSTGHILVGNHRWLAARDAGLAEVPVIWVDVDDDKARRIMVADNRTSELGDFDAGKLSALLESFDGDLEGTGYTVADLDDMLGSPAKAGATDADDVPEAPPSRTVAGDVWLLGEHRVMCGDSTSPTDVERLMAGGLADAVWTDPPYGVSYVGKTKDALVIENDGDLEYADVLAGAITSILTACRPGAAVYVAAPPGPASVPFSTMLSERGLFRQRLVWVKNVFVLGHSDYHYAHEDIYFGYVPGAAGRQGRGGAGWHGDNAQSSVLEYPRPQRSADHPTMKPVALIQHCLRNSTRHGDIVLDLFGGSGSTLIAAHQLGRVARLMELDPRYVDVICRRWQEHTGVVPVAESTGRPHSFVEDAPDGTPVEAKQSRRRRAA